MIGTAGASLGKWARRVEANDSDAALTVNQKSTGLILDLQDDGVSVFAVADGGGMSMSNDPTWTSISAGVQGIVMEIYHDSASPAINDIPFTMQIYGRDGAGTPAKIQYGGLRWLITNVTDTSEEGQLDIQLHVGGSLATVMAFKANNLGIPATGRIYLDGVGLSGDTYIHETASDIVQLVVGGTVMFQVRDAGGENFLKGSASAGAGVGIYQLSTGPIADFYAAGSAKKVTINAVGDIQLLTGTMAYGAPGSLVIASGVVAITKARHTLVVENGAGSGADDLVTATGGADGDILKLQTTTSGANDTVTIKNGTGSDTFILAGGADFVMNHIDDRIVFTHNGTEWVEDSRSDNS